MSETPPEPVNKILRVTSAAFAVVFALFVASALTLPTARAATSLGLVSEGTTGLQVLQTLLQFGWFLVAIVGYLAISDQRNLVRIARPTPRDAALILVGGLGLFAFQYGALVVLGELGLTTGQNQAVVPDGNPVTYYALMVAVSLLVVGPVEEALFRGVVQGGLRRAFDAVPSILMASAMFGLVHLVAVSGTPGERWAYVAVAVVLGAVLGLLYEHTDNVLVPGLAHGMYNAVIYVELLRQSL
ncbi:CPBP family intramembrane glutamic endopeptidase [Halorubrum halophilum]|uniref:CPBP family intramembrane glutamic endopeptidase n=1 Tax=Halorubrum halophilum TaxID=413816 RepID=UPI00186B4259|nr:type II CAAX endopeptidase family protein [Halorubrum halophilum]